MGMTYWIRMRGGFVHRLGWVFFAALGAWAQAAGAEPNTLCHDTPRYLVVEREVTDGVGSDFLVKYKTKPGDQPACAYVVKPGDLEIRNEFAQDFWDLRGDLLILDSGDGPDLRGIIIWDLKKRKMVYTATYAPGGPDSGSAAPDAKPDPRYLEFWMPTGEATDENCPQKKELEAGGLGTSIDTFVRLDLLTLTVTRTSSTRCSARQ